MVSYRICWSKTDNLIGASIKSDLVSCQGCYVVCIRGLVEVLVEDRLPAPESKATYVLTASSEKRVQYYHQSR